MVLIVVKKSDTSQFLFETTLSESNDSLLRRLVRVWNMRLKVELVAGAVESLPDAQREAFLLHEEGGLTIDEIAALTGVGRETTKSRLRYAMAKLRGCMAAYLDGFQPQGGAA